MTDQLRLTDFRRIVQTMSEVGVTGAKQQILICMLWENGPMTWGQVNRELGLSGPGNNLQMQTLVAKKLVVSVKAKKGRTMETTFSINPDVLEYLNKKTSDD